MTTSRYRLLLAVQVLSSLIYVALALAAGIRAEPYEPHLGQLAGALLMILSGVLIGTYAAMFIGLFTLQRWGRTLAVACTGLTLALLVFVPTPALTSTIQGLAYFVATTTWGAALALAYAPPLAAHFEQASAPRARDGGKAPDSP